MHIHVTEISYLDLAKEAKARGDMKGVWRAFKQHARIMKKKKTFHGHGKPTDKTDDMNSITQVGEYYAN